VQSGTVYICGVQLEIGSVATPLEKPDPQVDLANCSRFYQVGNIALQGDAAAATGVVKGMYTYPVKMRATATVIPSLVNTNLVGSPNALVEGFNDMVAFRVTNVNGSFGSVYWNGTFTASADL